MSEPYVQRPTFVPRKQLLTAYLLLIVLGGFGAHRFYLGRPRSAVAIPVLVLAGWALASAGSIAFTILGYACIVAVWVWFVVDLFLVPSLVRERNSGAQ
jgi:TM2 domain-containing membrane protein YozV